MKLSSLISALLIFIPGVVYGQDVDLIDDTKEKPTPAVSEKESAEVRAEIGCLGQHVDTFYAECGRYPTTQEGLRALTFKPKSIVCTKGGLKTGNKSKPYIAALPNNSSELEYTSTNGRFYRLKWVGAIAKHGEVNAGISVQDFLKTCIDSEKK